MATNQLSAKRISNNIPNGSPQLERIPEHLDAVPGSAPTGTGQNRASRASARPTGTQRALNMGSPVL